MSQLLNRKRKIESEIEVLKSQIGSRNLRLGLLGAPGSGKSSLFASWYLSRTQYELSCLLRPNEAAMGYLEEISEKMLATGVTSATALATPDELGFDLVLENEVWHIDTIDCAGGYFLPVREEGEKRVVEPVREFVRGCDVVLCLTYWNESSRETINAIDLCLQVQGTCVILVLTKFDELSMRPKSEEEVLAALEEVKANNDMIGELQHRIANMYNDEDGCAVVPLSALGWDISKAAKFPLFAKDLKPFNTFEPLLRAIGMKRRKQRQLSQQLVEHEAELLRLNSHLKIAASQHKEKARIDLEQAQTQLTTLKAEVMRQVDASHAPDDLMFDDQINHARRIEQVATMYGEHQLASDAASFKRFVWEKVETSRKRKQECQLEDDLKAIENEIAFHSSFNAPYRKWHEDLLKIEVMARQQGRPDLAMATQFRRGEIKRKEGIREVLFHVILFFVVVGAVILAASFMIYLLSRK